MRYFKMLFYVPIALCFFIPTILSAQMTWTCACASAPWPERGSFSSVIFHDTMWIFGGMGPGHLLNDIWYSTDGDSWICATDSAQWSARAYHTSLVFDNKMWLIGGLYWGGSNWVGLNDVWWSDNGINWTLATVTAPWFPRGIHTSVVFNDSIWVIGGSNGSSQFYHDVWKSADGDSWVCATNSAPWIARGGHTSVIFHDTMWVLGGYRTTGPANDIWYSPNGTNWTRLTLSVVWSNRYAHSSVAFDNKMWVMAGTDNSNIFNDVWFSTDGDSWICATDSAEWMAREYLTTLVYNNKIWLIAGSPDFVSGLTDVWYSTGLGIEEHPTPNVECITPNATVVHNILNLQSSTPNLQSEITLLDLTGRKVMNLCAGANNIRHLAPGVYFIRSNNNNLVTKIIVTK